MDRLDRRSALTIVGGLLAQSRYPPCQDTLVLDLAPREGCVIHYVKVQLGALSVTISTDELLKSLGAKLNGD